MSFDRWTIQQTGMDRLLSQSSRMFCVSDLSSVILSCSGGHRKQKTFSTYGTQLLLQILSIPKWEPASLCFISAHLFSCPLLACPACPSLPFDFYLTTISHTKWVHCCFFFWQLIQNVSSIWVGHITSKKRFIRPKRTVNSFPTG